MRDEKQKNVMFQGESMNSGFASPEVSFTKNAKPICSNNGSDMHFLEEASRKRKGTGLDQVRNVYHGTPLGYVGNFRGNLHYLSPRNANLQHAITAPPLVDSHGRTPANFSDHNLQAAKPFSVQSQLGGCHFHNLNSSSMSLPTKGTQFQETASDSSNSYTFYHEEPFLSFRTPTEELPKLTDSKQDEVAIQPESGKVQSCYSQVGRCMGKSQAAFRSHKEMNMGHGNDDISSKSYQCSMTSQNLPSLDPSQCQMTEKNLNMDGGSNGQDSKSGLFEAKRSDQNTNFLEVKGISMGETNATQLSAILGGEKSCGSYQNPDNGIRHGNHPCIGTSAVHSNVIPAESSGSEKVCLNFESLKNNAHASMDSEDRSLKKDDHIEAEKNDYATGEAKRLVVKGDQQPSNNLDEQIKSSTLKVPPATEKLWDGSLQLNASTTVSVVAFFKSGEKAQDFNWPEIVEIKGKVRLHAFEKFIQELPRSRSRALMVTSLCWKVGSSRAGLTGMKEFAKVYRENKRVGFVKICPGFDLYVCPRSDTIILLLAKYGFFKGMAAVEGDQDSLIGCVVWRRSQPSLSSAPTNLDESKTSMQDHPLLYPESSIAEVKSQPISEASSAANNVALKANESNTMQLSNKLSNSGSFKTKCGPGTNLSIPYNSPLIPAQPIHPQMSDSTSLQESMRYHLNSKNSWKPMPSAIPGPQQMFPEVPPRNIQSFDGPHNLSSFHSDPVPILPQLTRKPDSSCQQEHIGISSHSGTNIIPLPESMRPVLGSELAQIALAGPPQLPPEVLERLINSSRAIQKEPNEVILKAEIPLSHVAGPKHTPMNIDPRSPALPVAHPLLSKALNRSPETDVDDDLPEFDFSSACGVPKTSACGYLRSDHHMQNIPSFNNKLPIEVAKDAGGATSHELPSLKPRGSTQMSNSSSFLGEPLNAYHGVILPEKLGSFVSQNKPAAQISQLLNQPCTLTARKDSVVPSSSTSFSRNSNCSDDNDGDGMPEWCPSELQHLNQPPPSTTKLSSPVLKPTSEIAAAHPSLPAQSPASLIPPKGQGFCHGFQHGILGPHPASDNPAEASVPAQVQAGPTTKFVHSSPRPPLIRSTDHSSRPWTSKFDTKTSQSKAGWRS